MASAMNRVVGAAVFAALLALVVVLSPLPPVDAAQPSEVLLAGDGTGLEDPTRPMLLADLAGPAPQTAFGWWQGEPVMVLKLRLAPLAAAAEFHGYNTGQYAAAVPGEPEHVLLAYAGKNTHLGCANGWSAELGASASVDDYDGDGLLDGRFLSPCHFEQYDAYDLAAHQPRTPGNGPLDVFEVSVGPGKEGPIWIWQQIPQDEDRDADREGPGAAFRLAHRA